MDRKRFLAWLMLVFVLASAAPAHLWWAKGEPFWILVLSELALVYAAVVAIFVEEDK
jgi:membrane protein YdbS with pleckstrin-like domain